MYLQRDSEHRHYFHATMTDVDEVEFDHGNAAVFSSRSPEKDTDNEDAIALIPVARNSCVIAVADGVGGHPTGDIAARISIETITTSLMGSEDGGGSSIREAILDGIEKANKRVCEMGTGAATTLVVAEIQDNTVRSYHVGDSMIMIMGQRGKLKFQNTLHSPVGFAMESGLIGEKEAVYHDDRNLVSNLIGTADMNIEIGPVISLAVRDTLVLASDGLSDNLYVNEIVDIARKGDLVVAGNRLASLCHRRMTNPGGGHPGHADDLSFVLYRRK